MCGKMAEELLSLKWNNHQAHFVDILTFLREQEIFVDATLACGGKLYAAHKFVLSTCSDYFKQMFTKNPSKHPIVFMKDVTSRDLEALLDFMYNGEVNVPQSSLGSLIKTAEGLQIKGLAVPDDPPAPKRERDREKRENRTQLDHHHHHSPPAKRPRPRERSPPHSSPSQQSSVPIPSSNSQVSRSRSPPPPINPVGASQINMPPVEATLDEDSRTSVQSGVSGLSEQNTSTTPSLSSKQASGSTSSQVQQQQHNPDEMTHDSLSHGHAGGEEPSPGPSGLHKAQQPHQSKEEPEFEIKQEDVVELGEDDEGDWGVEGDGGGGESSVGADNPPNFPEVMLPHTDGSLPPAGDPAMGGLMQTKDILAIPPFQDSVGLATEGSLSHRMRVLASNMADGWGVESEGESRNGGRWGMESEGAGKNSGTASGSDARYGLGWSEVRVSTELSGTIERPFPCPYCPLSFKRRYTLQEHVRIHMGSRPYACRSCGKAFTQRSSLLKHVRMRVCQKHMVQN